MYIGIVSLLAFVEWFITIQEFIKPEEKQSNHKIVMLPSAGTMLTAVLTISLFQQFMF